MSNHNAERLQPVPRADSPTSARSNIRMRRKDFFADILYDKRSSPEIWHWIVQREGSPEILNWGHEPTQERAEEEASAYLESLITLKQFQEQQTN